MNSMKNVILTAAALLSLSGGVVQAASTYSNNFTMLDSGGGLVGGTNDVVFTWDGTFNTDPNTAVANATITSTTPFFGINWTAYNVKIYGPGTYAISTADTAGGDGCPFGRTTCASAGSYDVTVGADQAMVHMKFAWGSTEGIDVVNVWQSGSWSNLNPGNPIHTGAGGTYIGPWYSLVSTDWDGDGIAGGAMIDGPFQGFNANFNVNAVPVPAAAWLFGSGLLGLLSMARRKKNG